MADFEQIQRPRRLRQSEGIRALAQETDLQVRQLVAPLFIREGLDSPQPIESLPGQLHHTQSSAVETCRALYAMGIPAVLLFGIPLRKNEIASEAYNDHGYLQQAIRSIKEQVPELVIITDVCLCAYMSHGHCGVLAEGCIQNDETLPLLAAMALSHARSGADMLAPSDMMDGRVGAIRRALDQQDFSHKSILAYSVKYASNWYGPFREAAHSAPQSGDRKSYQMAYTNAREALRELELDQAEGADMVMVKPAGPYLDIIHQVRQKSKVPVVAYQVSGEYASIRLGAQHGLWNEDQAILESVYAIRRAGADIIITYFAQTLANLLKQIR